MPSNMTLKALSADDRVTRPFIQLGLLFSASYCEPVFDQSKYFLAKPSSTSTLSAPSVRPFK